VFQPAIVTAPSKSIPPVCLLVFFVLGPPLGVLGVGHPASSVIFLLLSLFPASLYSSVAGLPAIGVGQPASVDACPSVRPNPLL
jgi:hypothetical protein